jgi:two-component system, OmpR family, sensor histidine kinase BaeS
MKINITARLFLVILVAIILSVVSFVLLVRWEMDRTFLRHLNTLAQATVLTLQEEAEDYYQRKGSWNAFREKPERWGELLYLSVKKSQPDIEIFTHRGPDEGRKRDDHKKGPGDFRPAGLNILTEHFVLFDQDKTFIVGRRDIEIAKEFYPVTHDSQIVGYIGFVPTKDLLNEKQRRLLKDLESTLLTLGGIITVLSAVISLLLARKMVRPIKQLASGTHQLAAGDLSTRVHVNSCDEIGTLADDFNHLAFTLEKNEQARRQWMAEISHELRTPVAVLRGEIEALQDGIRPLNQTALSSLHSESVLLGRLADDLYQLAMADVGTLTYKKTLLDLPLLLNDVCRGFEELFNAEEIALNFDYADNQALAFFGDESRLRQLCDNLLDNALKYTDLGGQVRVNLSTYEHMAVIDVQDSSPGVERDELEKLLDRFYRSPKNQKTSGGVGLGLSICRNIVEGHQGQMTVKDSPLGGLWVRIEMPIRESLS